MLISSGAGMALVPFVPWSEAARQAGIPRACAFAIGPFLLGLLAVVALGVFRGASHAFHIGVVFTGLILLCSAAALARPLPQLERLGTPRPIGRWEWVFGGLLAAWVALLIVDSLFMPLMQNDALEYATVGRLLFEVRDLFAYPALDPAVGTSGFYGPWTHPPLYPALIYLANALQGHADTPGLMRLISPWCTLVATAVVYSMGCLANRITGLLSALIFLSTPLLFLGACSALIEPLPVLGMTLLLCAVTLVEGTPVRRGTIQGIALGIALWTHSQAVLFVPLTLVAVMLNSSRGEPGPLARQLGVLLGIAGLMAAWPYCRNIMLFGSFISDAPAVFVLDRLGWAEYFSKVRGLASWPEKIQYGILKGWFALEAYSWSFWLMLPGVAFCLRHWSRRHVWETLRRGQADGIPDRWKLVMLGVMLFYLGGVVLSILIGSDLMIRNERYLLVLMPCVSLFAGSGIGQMLTWASLPKHGEVARADNRLKWIGVSFVLLVLLVGFAQLIVVGGYRWKTLDLSPEQIWLSHEEKLRNWPAFRTVYYLRHGVPQEATVLSLKPADMYYAGRRMISYLDPRLLPFFSDCNDITAAQKLRDLGVSYIHIPDYSIPPIYDSALQGILGRSDLARLVYSAGGNQLYELRSADAAIPESAIDLSPGVIPWNQISQLNLGGRKGLFRLSLSSRILDPGEFSSPRFSFPFFQRDLSTLLISSSRNLFEGADTNDVAAKSAAREYRLDLDMEGEAFAHVYLKTFSREGRLQEEYLIGEVALGQRGSVRRFTRRFMVQPHIGAISIVVEHRGRTTIRIERATIIPLRGESEQRAGVMTFRGYRRPG